MRTQSPLMLRLFLVAQFFLLGFGVLAQVGPDQACDTITHVDITLIQTEDQQLEVWLTSQQDFDGYFAAMTFTVRWTDADGANLGNVIPQVPYFSLSPSGSEWSGGELVPYRYQIYAGFSVGFNTLAQWEMPWQAGEPVLLATIEIINGNSYFQIVEDDFTANNNGDYYVSLGGYNCYGEITTITVGTPEAGITHVIGISPNPTSGLANLTLALPEKTALQLELFDASGRSVWHRGGIGAMGMHVEQLDLNGLSDGVYLLKVHAGEHSSTHRLVLGTRSY